MAVRVSRRRCLQVIILIVMIQIVIVVVLLSHENESPEDEEPRLAAELQRASQEGEFKVLPDAVAQEKWKAALFWSAHKTGRPETAAMQVSPEVVLDAMATTYHWKWMRSRVISLLPDWMSAVDKLSRIQNMENRTQLKILVSPGLLTQTNFAQMESIRHGGPLGELVQWADLVAALTLLGHNVTLQHNIIVTAAMLSFISGSFNGSNGCFPGGPDLIFTDYSGMSAMSAGALKAFRHKLRVLDIYGTEAPFNNPKVAEAEGFDVKEAFDLHLQQFYTLYPSTPDNSFLGFAVRQSKASHAKKRNVAVVYGKEAKHIVHNAPMLRALSGSFELHATTTRSAFLPQFIINHGVLPPSEYASVLQSAKVMIGVGHPVEGPGALEAIAKGLIFLNPSFPRENPLQHKPTMRKLSSQVPYAEQYIGPPNVITLDVNDISAVLEAIPSLNKTVKPVLPYEFSMEGYLQRLNYFLRYQDFCNDVDNTELLKSLRVKESKMGQDCIETCRNKGLVCDRSLFSPINDQTFYQRTVAACKEFITKDDATVFPSLHVASGTCHLQSNPKIFSCAGLNADHVRFCPCRTYRRHQIALCETCR